MQIKIFTIPVVADERDVEELNHFTIPAFGSEAIEEVVTDIRVGKRDFIRILLQNLELSGFCRNFVAKFE